MTEDQLYLKIMEDMKGRLVSEDEYTLLGLARLLRQLVVDGGRLLDRVGQPRHWRIEFKVARYAAPSATDFDVWDIHDCFDPDWDELAGGTGTPMMILINRAPQCTYQLPTRAAELVDLTQFLSKPKVLSHRELFSVKDMIKYLANTAGGVHMDIPKEKRDKAFAHYIEMLAVAPTGIPAQGQAMAPVAIRGVKAIGRVVYRSLLPLTEQVAADVSQLAPAFMPFVSFDMPNVPPSTTRPEARR